MYRLARLNSVRALCSHPARHACRRSCRPITAHLEPRG